MKKIVCNLLVLCLLFSPLAVYASEEKIVRPFVEPTPYEDNLKTMKTENFDILCSEISDYDGRIKEENFIVNGDSWTVVEKIGAQIEDEEVMEGFSGFETVYEERYNVPSFASAAYTTRTLTNTRNYLKNGNLVAATSESYTVYYYDNGKVHIAAHSISKNTAAGYGSSDFVLGTVVNTDGSVSYTRDFKFVVNGTFYSVTYDFNFIVTYTYNQCY